MRAPHRSPEYYSSLLERGFEAAPRYLEPQEELIVSVPARIGGAILHYIGLAGIEPYLGDYLQGHVIVYLTNHRLLLVREISLAEKPGPLETVFPVSQMQVAAFKEGRHWFSFPVLVLRTGDKTLRLNFEPPYRRQAKELATGIAELGRA